MLCQILVQAGASVRAQPAGLIERRPTPYLFLSLAYLLFRRLVLLSYPKSSLFKARSRNQAEARIGEANSCVCVVLLT